RCGRPEPREPALSRVAQEDRAGQAPIVVAESLSSRDTQETHRERELQLLGRVAEALNSAADVEQALEQTLALVAELLGLETGWVWLRAPETDRFYSAAARSLPPYLQEPVRMTGEPCWCIESFRAGRLTPANIRLIQCSQLYAAVAANDTTATRGLCC